MLKAPMHGRGIHGAFRRGCLSGGMLLLGAFAQAQTLTPASLLSTLIAALEMEEEASVRAAICESIGRLPYRAAGEAARAEAALLEVASDTHTITDRLGVVKGLEALVRIHRTLSPPSPRAIATLRMFAGLPEPSPVDSTLPGRSAR